MTAFLIVLIIFLIAQTNSKISKTARSKEYFRKTKSNAKLQYDTACETIKKMGATYREGIKLLSLKEFLLESYGKVNSDYRYKESYILKNKNFLEYITMYKERMWIVSTARACNIKLNNECLKILYDNVWECIPAEYSKEFLEEWIIKYHLQCENKKQISTYLKSSVLLKNSILHHESNGNSYVAYNNKKALDYVAKQFNLPTNDETCKLNHFGYNSLQDLCFLFTGRHSHTKGREYLHIPLTMICENPTAEQKQIQYSKLSESERLSKEIREEAKIREKYNLD